MFFKNNSKHYFSVGDAVGVIEQITDPNSIDRERASHVLVESFISEYKNPKRSGLLPSQISNNLTDWYGEKNSVENY